MKSPPAATGQQFPFRKLLLQGVSVWVLCGLAFWVTEMLVVAASLSLSWDYGLIRGGPSKWEAVSLVIRKEEVARAYLFYVGVWLLGACISIPATYILGRRRPKIDTAKVLQTAAPLFSVFVIGVLWLNAVFLEQGRGLSLKTLSATALYAVFCAGLFPLTYRRLVRAGERKASQAFFKLLVGTAGFVFAVAFSLCIGIFDTPNIRIAALSIGAFVISLVFYLVPGRILAVRLAHWVKLEQRRDAVLTIGAVFLLAAIAIIVGFNPDFVSGRESGNIQQDKPNVLFIVMDTTRADHLSSYGYTPNTTPNIDEISREGTLYRRVVSPTGWTVPSHASMFTGLFPHELGVGHTTPYLGEGVETLAEIFTRNGYRTLGYSNNAYVSPFTGLSRGFEQFHQGWMHWITERYRYAYQIADALIIHIVHRADPEWNIHDKGAAKTNRIVSDWITRNMGSPFMVFINYMETHLPYAPPPPIGRSFIPPSISDTQVERFTPSARKLREMVLDRPRNETETSVIHGLYDGEVRYLDEKIGELIQLMKKLQILDQTLVIITSDHGENLGEHGLVGHAYGIFNTLLDVPLIIRYPKAFQPGTVIDQGVQTPDLFYTILDAAGFNSEVKNRPKGRESLIQRAKNGTYEDYMIAERDRPGSVLHWAQEQGVDVSHVDKDLRAILTNNFKYLLASDGEESLFDLEKDPGELRNVAASLPGIATDMKKSLLAVVPDLASRQGNNGLPAQMDARTKEQLRALGYMK